MAFQLSPGVNVTEVDLTTTVPAVSTSVGAFAGLFGWGPVGERVLVDSETKLAETFGKPTNYNAETFLAAANFFGYGNALIVARAANTTNALSTVTSVSVTGTTSTGYNNNDIILIVPPTGGTNAVASFVTNGSGGFVSFTITNAGTGFKANQLVSTDNIFIANSTGGFPASGNNIVTSIVAAAGVSTTGALSAVANTSAVDLQTLVVKNRDDYDSKLSFASGSLYIAKYPGDLGNSLRVSICDSVNAYQSAIDIIGTQSSNTVSGSLTVDVGSNTGVFVFTSDNGTTAGNTAANTYANSVVAQLSIGDIITIGNSSIGTQNLKISSVGAPSVTASSVASVNVAFADINKLASNYVVSNTINGNSTVANVTRSWEYIDLVKSAPGTSAWQAAYGGNTSAVDTLHVVIIDQDGKFGGVAGAPLEIFEGLSRATDAKTAEGATLYYETAINQGSRYVWTANDRAGAASNTAANITSSSNDKPLTLDFVGGDNGLGEASVPVTTLTSAYDLFKSKEAVDISLLIAGKPRGGTSNTQLGNYLIDNIAEIRKDCVVFISPDDGIVRNNPGNEASALVTWKSSVRDSTYAVLDTGYKYMYDKYNDLYRYVPMNGDIAGLAARTDNTNDSWFSPAGFNRGQIKNIIKLRFNPSQADRDLLYKNAINPVVSFPAQGTILYGDKTATLKPSAFDRINVRRLFITLEKSISQVAKYSLFEFNDEFTRSQFVNLVTPFLRDVKGRRGITDFLVVCDSTNNTPERVDRNEFWGDIYIKPARSINFIQLNFVAVRTGVEFSTVVGRF